MRGELSPRKGPPSHRGDRAIAQDEDTADFEGGRRQIHIERRAKPTAGVLPISNAHVERLLRTAALFRKNSLFVGSLEAGEPQRRILR